MQHSLNIPDIAFFSHTIVLTMFFIYKRCGFLGTVPRVAGA
jgi:hypothetical protein